MRRYLTTLLVTVGCGGVDAPPRPSEVVPADPPAAVPVVIQEGPKPVQDATLTDPDDDAAIRRMTELIRVETDQEVVRSSRLPPPGSWAFLTDGDETIIIEGGRIIDRKPGVTFLWLVDGPEAAAWWFFRRFVPESGPGWELDGEVSESRPGDMTAKFRNPQTGDRRTFVIEDWDVEDIRYPD